MAPASNNIFVNVVNQHVLVGQLGVEFCRSLPGSFPRSLDAEETGRDEEDKNFFLAPADFSKQLKIHKVVFNFQITLVVLVKNNNFPCELHIISPVH